MIIAIVCNLSGVPQNECDYSCPNCRKEYRGVPDLEGIRAACVLIRANWTRTEERARWAGTGDRVLKLVPLEIPAATLVWDHMRRKPESGD